MQVCISALKHNLMNPRPLKGLLDSLRASVMSEMEEWRVLAPGTVQPHGVKLHTNYADVKALLSERRDRIDGKL